MWARQGEMGNEDAFGGVRCAPYSHLDWVSGWSFRSKVCKS